MIKIVATVLLALATLLFAIEIQDEEEILTSESFLTSTCADRAKKLAQSPPPFDVLETSMLTQKISRSEEADSLDSASEYIFTDGVPETLTEHVAFVEVAERARRIRYQCSFIVDGERRLFFHRMTSIGEENGTTNIDSFQIYRLNARLVNTSSVEFSDKLEYLFRKYL